MRENRFLIDAGWIFAQHFCNRLGPAYIALKVYRDPHTFCSRLLTRRFVECFG